MKKCILCKQIKSFKNFTKDKNRKDGLNPYCKECYKIKSKEQRKKHASKRSDDAKIYYQKNKEKIRIRNNKWKERNLERYKNLAKKWQLSPVGRYADYKKSALHRKLEFSLTFQEFMTFWQKPCYYCGDEIKTIGIDRINSKKGYLNGNMVSCCSICNTMKWNLSQKDFVNHCKKIIARDRSQCNKSP